MQTEAQAEAIAEGHLPGGMAIGLELALAAFFVVTLEYVVLRKLDWL